MVVVVAFGQNIYGWAIHAFNKSRPKRVESPQTYRHRPNSTFNPHPTQQIICDFSNTEKLRID